MQISIGPWPFPIMFNQLNLLTLFIYSRAWSIDKCDLFDHKTATHEHIRPRGDKTFFVLNSVEHDIYPDIYTADKY